MKLTFSISNLATASPADYLQDADLSRHPMGLHAFDAIEADFAFWIDAECVLQEPYWNVGELARQLKQWLHRGLTGDFHYHCSDAEETDLFTFRWQDKHFQFVSVWGIGESTIIKVVDREALAEFIPRFSAEVKERVRLELGLDVSYFLS